MTASGSASFLSLSCGGLITNKWRSSFQAIERTTFLVGHEVPWG